MRNLLRFVEKRREFKIQIPDGGIRRLELCRGNEAFA